MIHLIGLVFNNGTGFVLFNDELFDNQSQNSLIWGLTQAITSFAMTSLKSEGKLELIAGKYRIVFYDPFLELLEHPEFAYTLVGIQDIYNNMDMCLFKLKSIHDLILTSGLDSNLAFLTFGEYLNYEILEKIKIIVEKTLIFPIEYLDNVSEIIKGLTNIINPEIIPLAVFLTDMDGGIVVKCFSRRLIEDPAFSESTLNNLIAESPLDTQTFWLERNAQKTMIYSLNLKINEDQQIKETFLSINLDNGKSDFCLLCRIIFYSKRRNELQALLQETIQRLRIYLVREKR